MANYIIIGGDQKEYGPVSADDVRQWIAEGRLDEKSLVKEQGEAGFRPLQEFPEFAGAFGGKTAAPGPQPLAAGFSGGAGRDYELDLGGCISRGWTLFKDHFSVLFVTALVMMLIEGVLGGLGSIPLIGPVFSLANLIIAGPLMGGLYYVYLQTIRGGAAEVGDVFAGFRKCFGQLFLGHLVPSLLAALCLIPFVIVLAVTVVPLLHGQPGHAPNPETLANELSKTSVWLLVGSLVVCLIPMIYLQICWAFTLPLIMDKGLDFWTAMGVSRKMVSKHWWQVFGLMILISLVNLLGVMLCFVGLLFTVPVGFAALMFAYETIFTEGPAA